MNWAELIERERPRLFGLAYRMLGSAVGAEDVLQETFLRVRNVAEPVVPAAYLTTVVTRLCLDALACAKSRRETYVGPWLPEPVHDTALGGEPERAALLSESARMAFLLVLERLSPPERAVFLLRDVFDYDFSEIGSALEKTDTACRQLYHRARQHVDAARPRCLGDRAAHQRLAASFFSALARGDVGEVERLLAPSVEAVTDSAGEVQSARNVVVGAERVTRLLSGLAKKFQPTERTRFDSMQIVNGMPALIIWEGERIHTLIVLDASDDRIQTLHVVRAPSKLRWLEAHLCARESQPTGPSQ